MFSTVKSLGLNGIDAYLVTVEADLSRGLPGFDIVGLPDAAVKESRDRVRSAAKNTDLSFPTAKIVVNLAPASMKKVGSVYDLAVMISILTASGEITCDILSTGFIGELSLGGELRGITGVLPMVLEAGKLGLKEMIIPYSNACEGSSGEDVAVYAARNLREVILHITGKCKLPLCSSLSFDNSYQGMDFDFSDVRGQVAAKRALVVSAAGGHNLLMIGPPGSGKSMLAKRLPSVLPPMTRSEKIETTKIHSVAGFLSATTPLIEERVFRSPHHTVSSAGLSGGGSNPKPGEVSLAHNGVLFLDELPEFSRNVMEAMRQPIEDGYVTISRAGGRVTYPSQFVLVAAMNPCPCGFYGHPTKKCTCSPTAISKYLAHISGPLLDRIDIHIEVPPVDFENLSSTTKGENSEDMRQKVWAARSIQTHRFAGTETFSNAQIPRALLQEMCPLDDGASHLLRMAFDKLGLSARGYDRIVKVSRTIADLEGSEIIKSHHISEAVQYRTLDRKYWNR